MLFMIVNAGSQKLSTQQAALDDLVIAHDSLALENSDLQSRIVSATQGIARLDEPVQKRIAIMPHDGPAQMLAFILMIINEIEDLLATVDQDQRPFKDVVHQVREAAQDALADMRGMSSGLFLKPSHGIGGGGIGQKVDVKATNGALVMEVRQRAGDGHRCNHVDGCQTGPYRAEGHAVPHRDNRRNHGCPLGCGGRNHGYVFSADACKNRDCRNVKCAPRRVVAPAGSNAGFAALPCSGCDARSPRQPGLKHRISASDLSCNI
ncbi:hypothetical protein [Pseudogemmobacter sp. W21_MBD1_M6]|uniref:hypothetical protein n=1 Tax=Pseudogemmobacter sp. W21_MBD1_M6 TaxID=3240271 RepID=UPI003F99776F